jgi:hypothetical protein
MRVICEEGGPFDGNIVFMIRIHCEYTILIQTNIYIGNFVALALHLRINHVTG